MTPGSSAAGWTMRPLDRLSEYRPDGQPRVERQREIAEGLAATLVRGEVVDHTCRSHVEGRLADAGDDAKDDEGRQLRNQGVARHAYAYERGTARHENASAVPVAHRPG